MERRIRPFCLLVLFWSISAGVLAQYDNLKFEKYSTLEGLSSSTSIEIFEDSKGFLWFGTIDGLNKYDGYGFQIYRPILNDLHSISNNRINAIVEDTNSNLWIGTSNGLNMFDRETGRFYRIDLYKERSPASKSRAVINDLLYDQSTGWLWIATRNGVSRLMLEDASIPNSENVVIDHYYDKLDSESIEWSNVTSILKDKKGDIWLGAEGEYLSRYNPSSNSFEGVRIEVSGTFELDHLPKVVLVDNDGDFWIGNNLSSLILWRRDTDEFEVISPVKKHVPIFDIYQDKNGAIWIATDGDGIYIYHKNQGLVKHIVHNAADPFSLPNNQVSKILEDSNGILWFATYNGGFAKLALSKSTFGHYFFQPGNPNSLSTNIAQSVLQDKSGNIWIGTDGGGLNLFDEKENRFKHFRANPEVRSSLSSDKILYMLESYDGELWVCTWDGGLNKFDPKTEKAISYKHDEANPRSIGQNTVWCASEDNLHRLWLGTQTAGLNLFDPNTREFSQFIHNAKDSTSILSNFVFSTFIDSQQRLFVGTSLGLDVVDLAGLSGFIPDKISFREVKERNIQGNRINYITEDHLGNIWVGTDLGLHKLDGQLALLNSYTTQHGLPNNLILGIVEDNSGFLWVSTKGGLSRLNPETNDFRNFNVHDGVQGLEFQSKSIDKTQDGRILVGGINGLNVFAPEEVYREYDRIKPIITEFKMFNKVVFTGDTINGRVLLKRSIGNLEPIHLKYNEGYISFSFVALNYENPDRIRYMYRMTGLDEDFSLAELSRVANYSNLAPGDYTFEVKATEDGDWDNAEVTKVMISISPPPWRTWWAYTLYILFLAAALWIPLRYYTRLVREEKEHELDQMKLRFFINVSHEFRTPLTLILNPVDKIISSYDNPEEVKASAYTIQRSARRLLNLVDQLLDFRKMDLKKERLNLVRADIVRFGRDICQLFEDLAKSKNIQLVFESSLQELPVMFDPDKIEKIITNLLSNSLKFTEAGGTVTFTISKSTRNKILNRKKGQEYFELKIQDTGVGFKKEQLKDVFRRFFHVDNTKTGTGIGLNFTKGLVELHGGEIWVESEYQKGSTFTVQLPTEPDPETLEVGAVEALGAYEYNQSAIQSAEYEIAISDTSQVSEEEFAVEGGATRPVILVVEDNKELRLHLKNELKGRFKVRVAVNGAEGLEMVNKYYPDVIISDVMMPEMDGFELCRRVKSEFETCHIPVVLLTARSLEEDRIEGYKTGADEYLPKPFNIRVLQARINGLLEMKKRLRNKFASIGGIMPSNEITSNSLDEVFLDKATKYILENISDPDFELEALLSELGVSRSQFYRKVNSLTGQNPSGFIRAIRLKYASELLVSNKYSIKEIAYMSGFNSAAYFSKTFREMYNMTPKEYADQHTGSSQ
ncbi:two-component regulator propeller domain-containing protein [Algoriphagus jejuensis]|uniref:histidine kinase n=1 Tax=Algoriphagus jejuensis TaxID=419934 RepID=A0ABN1MVL4_9BACT